MTVFEEALGPKRQAQLAELLPDGRLELIEDSYSFVQEDQPEHLIAVVRDFLAAGAGRRKAAGSHA